MPITIQEVIDLPHLGCELIAGQAGASREVTWAHVCELEDPLPWLEGGELVMTTGIAIPPGSRRQHHYLTRLQDAGARALAISRDLRAPRLSHEFLHAADDLGFPILLVSLEVPFLAIARVVIMANQDAAYHEIVRQLSVFDVLRAGHESDTTALFHRLEDVSGYRLYLSTQTGTPLLPGVPPLPGEYEELLARPPGTPAYVSGGYALTIPIGGRTAGILLGLRTQDSESGGLAALQHIATIAALQRATLEREREIERRTGGELLAELMKGRDAHEIQDRIATRLREEDISLYLIRAGDANASSTLLHQQMTDLGCEHLIITQQEIVLLAPTAANVTVGNLLDTLPNTHAGRSRAFQIGGSFALAEHQARLALNRSIERDERFTDASSFAAELDWLPSDTALRKGFQERVLGPLLTRTKGAGLLDTLRVWLQCDRRPGETARRLGIHPHTLTYRLQRIEALTGLDLSTPSAVVELWLALEMRRDEPAEST